MRQRSAWLFATVGALMGLAAGFAVWGGRSEASGTLVAGPAHKLTPVVAPVVGGLAPQFEAADPDGRVFSMSEARGRVVLLNFWATWCEPCRAEMPLLQARSGGDASGVLVVGVNSDGTSDQILAYREALGVTFPLVLDPGGKVEALYRVRGLPTSYLIDAAGVVQFVHLGSMDAETLDGYLHQMGLN